MPLWFFSTYFRLFQKIIFRNVEFKLLNEVPDGPVLLLQNHFSWWDGYWSWFISEKILKRRFHVMMLEEQLIKRMFLTRTGVFSVDKNKKNVLPSMRYAAQLLSDPRNVVTIYPQGQIYSHYIDTVIFEKGAEMLLKNNEGKINVVFATAHISFGSPARPKAKIRVKYVGNRAFNLIELQDEYNDFYSKIRNQVILDER